MLPQRHKIRNWLASACVGELLAPETYRIGTWAETIAITLLACLLGWLVSPEDPLFIHNEFTWLWLAPILIALRYGVIPGVVSALGLLANWELFVHLSGQDAGLPKGYFTGGMLLVLICGEFKGVWSSRYEQRNEANGYLNERLTRLTRRYLLLRLSHDRIEQELLGKKGSLRDALTKLRDIASDKDAPLPNIGDVLQLIAQYCQLESASVYSPPQAQGDHFILSTPLAVTGKHVQLDGDDAMLKRVMEHHVLVHVGEHTDTQQLVIAPIVTSDDQILGILTITHMPFFALNNENLQLLELLLGYYADVVHVSNEVHAIREQLPDSPLEFIDELVRVNRIQLESGLDSHVVVFRFAGDKANEIADEMERNCRAIDVIWPISDDTQPALAVLLPLASKSASEEYILRIKLWLRERYGINDDLPWIKIVNIALSHNNAVMRLRSSLSEEANS